MHPNTDGSCPVTHDCDAVWIPSEVLDVCFDKEQRLLLIKHSPISLSMLIFGRQKSFKQNWKDKFILKTNMNKKHQSTDLKLQVDS